MTSTPTSRPTARGAMPALVVALAVLVAACGGGEGAEAASEGAEASSITITDARTPAPPGVDFNGAVYMTIENTGDEDALFVSASTDVAGETQIHETVMGDAGMRMQEIPELAVPAGGTVTLEPGGLHVMLLDLQEELAVGDAFELTMSFEGGTEQTVEVEVVDPADSPEMDMQHDGDSGMGDMEGMDHGDHGGSGSGMDTETESE